MTKVLAFKDTLGCVTQTQLAPIDFPANQPDLTKNPTIPIQRMGPRHLRRLRSAEDFISAYLRLCEDDKASIERFLALAVYRYGGMSPYTPCSKRNGIKGHDWEDWRTTAVAGAWSRWARMIRRANLSEFERGEAVREMLGALISQKNKDVLAEPELREAAEKALEWTSWHVHNSINALSRKSPEWEIWRKALESRTDVEAATTKYRNFESRQYYVLMRKDL